MGNSRVMRQVEEAGGAETPATASKVELLASMIEAVSPVCSDLAGIRSVVAAGRERLGRAASAAGLRAVAMGAPIGRAREPRVVSRKGRYRDLHALYGLLVTQQEMCGCHVHVGVADRETAVAVVNRLRPWLPTLLALSANSPFCEGADTGYASWRSVAISRWPATDIPPHFSSAKHYDQVTAMLHESGVLLETAQPYWLARPSAVFPTVEVRVADVAATVDEAVLQAALCRAMVRTACAELDRGEAPGKPDDEEILRAALWSAARHGMRGPAVHPSTGRQVPATAVLGELLDWIRPALRELGDEDETDRLLAVVARDGNGAERQRALAGTGGVAAAAARLVDEFDIGRTTA